MLSPDEAYQLLASHVNVSREAFDKLSIYHDLLLKWQSSINLVGPETIASVWQRHFLDSLQLLNYIPDRRLTLVDMGSGAGFPGMALAIAGLANVHIIESDTKKMIFLKEVARITSTSLHFHHTRIERVSISNVGIVTARACSDLSTLLKYAAPFVSHETICLFHKGKNYSKEIEDARVEREFDCSVFPSVSNDFGVILKLSCLREIS